LLKIRLSLITLNRTLLQVGLAAVPQAILAECRSFRDVQGAVAATHHLFCVNRRLHGLPGVALQAPPEPNGYGNQADENQQTNHAWHAFADEPVASVAKPHSPAQRGVVSCPAVAGQWAIGRHSAGTASFAEKAMSQSLRVVMAQLNLRVGDVHGNVERIIEAANEAREQWQADLVCSPSCPCAVIRPKTCCCVRACSDASSRGCSVCWTKCAASIWWSVIPGWKMSERFNACAVLADGELLGRYYKQNLPNYRVFDEKRYFAAGNQPCVVDIKGVPVALSSARTSGSRADAPGARGRGAALAESECLALSSWQAAPSGKRCWRCARAKAACRSSM
jgi:hypothetical protein